jgi:secretion/DNA translocation related CpaE-like protein
VHILTSGAVPDELFRIAVAIGAEAVDELPRSESWVVETLTDLGDVGARRGVVIGVVGGSGGAGATTVACALAQTASRAGEAVVVDCDPLGPGVDRVLGLESHDGFRWDALCQTTGRLSARSLREALPRRGSLGALSWLAGTSGSLQAFAVREALSAARRGHDVVVVDLPRSTDALVEEVAARCDLLLVVVVPTVAGVASATRLCARFPDHHGLRLLVRGQGIEPRELTRVTGVAVVAEMRDQPRLGEAIDLGLGPVRSPRGPLGRACSTVLTRARDTVLDAAA